METKTINLRDLPDELVRRAKACAALHGITLKEFVIHSLAAAIERDIPGTPAFSALFGSLKGPKNRRRREIKKKPRQ